MKQRTRRALAVLVGLGALGGASALVLNAFRATWCFSSARRRWRPTRRPRERSFRVGGLVEQAACSATAGPDASASW
jgi:cytochrome c-type biogenesis protein CcmE